MQHSKATAWGADVMGIAGLAGAVLGPSPLLLPLAPLVAVANAPMMIATTVLRAPLGVAELGVAAKVAFVGWCVLFGAGEGRLIGAWRARRLTRRTIRNRDR